jgi:hypothetical protein
MHTSHHQIQNKNMAKIAKMSTIYSKRHQNTCSRSTRQETSRQGDGRNHLVDLVCHIGRILKIIAAID